MRRKTEGYIPHENIDATKINEILNSDRGTINESDGVDGTELIANGNFYAPFINGDGQPNTPPATRDNPTDYSGVDPLVPGDTAQERYNNVFDGGGFDLGDLRGYGGNEDEGECVGVPEIYWKSIITEFDGECVPLAESLDVMIKYNLYPEITLPIDTLKLQNFVNTSIVDDKSLVSDIQSAFYRSSGEQLLKSIIATQIGIDYPNGSCGVPSFRVKVTPYLMDVDNYKIRNPKGNPFPVLYGFLSAASLLIADILVNPSKWATTRGFLGHLELIIRTKGEALLDYLIGPNDPIRLIATGQFETFIPFKDIASGLAEDVILNNYFIPIMVDLAIIKGIMLGIDAIWDMTRPDIDIENIAYQYQNVIASIYTFEDISDSSFKIALGDKRQFIDNIETHTINSKGSYSRIYSLDNPNYAELWSISNRIDTFPNSYDNGKYLNFSFNPKSWQYDYNTPPPIIGYHIELEPVSNCILSETKLTKFSVIASPDRYYLPKFSIITDINNESYSIGIGSRYPDPITGRPRYESYISTSNVVYRNTGVLFKNARFADYILLKSKDQYGADFLSKLLDRNMLEDYYIRTFNRYTESSNTPDVISIVPTGNHIYATGSDGLHYIPEGFHYVYFMMEKQSNLIRNPYFRVEKDDNDLNLSSLTRFWTPTNVVIRNGGAYLINSGSSGRLTQNLSKLSNDKYYKFHISILGNNCVHLKLSDTFKNNIYEYCDAIVGDSFFPNYDKFSAENCEIVSISGDNYLRFNSSGEYYLVLKTLNSISSKTLLIYITSGFSGCINEVTLQYMPHGPAGSETNSYNALTETNQQYELLYVHDTALRDKDIDLYSKDIDTAPSNISINIGLNPVSDINTELSIIWHPYQNYLDGSLDYITYTTNISLKTYEQDLEINSPVIATNDNVFDKIRRIVIRAHYSIRTTSIYLIRYLEISNCNIAYISDNRSLLRDSELIMNNTLLGIEVPYIFNHNDRPSGRFGTGFKFSLNNIPVSMKGLNLSGCSNIAFDTKDINMISDYLIISSTNVTGDLSEIISIPRIEADNTQINVYGISRPKYDITTQPYIIWKNSNIGVDSLQKLLKDLDDSQTWNGYLDISGSNPEIDDDYSLQHINNLRDKYWNVYYNEVTIPVITLIGDNPLTWNLGETFVDPGATAYDGKDGDITSDIVATSTVNINTEGTYQVSYNVTDSNGNAAEEVIRVVNVEEVQTGVFTMTTTSTSSTWSPQLVVNSGAILHWSVTGAVSYEVDTNDPTFNFSTPGTKYITVTSADNFIGVIQFECYSNQLTSLDVSKLSNLIRLVCHSNQLTTLDVSGLSNLTYLSCSINQLTTLDVSGLSNIRTLYCNNNQLTTLDASRLSNLTGLTCKNNQLTTLNVSGLSNLQSLSCESNKLTTLNVSGLSNLLYLYCDNNQLTMLDVLGLSKLGRLHCYVNQLTSLDVSGLSNLKYLYCYRNQLTTSAINIILDQLIAINNISGSELNAKLQLNGGCGDPAKIAVLDTIWDTVLVDACY